MAEYVIKQFVDKKVYYDGEGYGPLSSRTLRFGTRCGAMKHVVERFNNIAAEYCRIVRVRKVSPKPVAWAIVDDDGCVHEVGKSEEGVQLLAKKTVHPLTLEICGVVPLVRMKVKKS